MSLAKLQLHIKPILAPTETENGTKILPGRWQDRSDVSSDMELNVDDMNCLFVPLSWCENSNGIPGFYSELSWEHMKRNYKVSVAYLYWKRQKSDGRFSGK
jgi:hypothetical protein